MMVYFIAVEAGENILRHLRLRASAGVRPFGI
jgi:hypothetical protein